MIERDRLAELAIGRSTIRRRILELLLENGGPPYHLREIQRRAATSPGTASRELAHLVRAGLVERRPQGVQVTFAAAASPLVDTLRGVAADPAAHATVPDQVAYEMAGRLAAMLRDEYGDRLRGVLLTGSRARGDHSPGSDVNVVIVLDRIEWYGEELDRTSVAVANLSLEFGIVLSRLFVTDEEWQRRTDAYFAALRRGSIEL